MKLNSAQFFSALLLGTSLTLTGCGGSSSSSSKPKQPVEQPDQSGNTNNNNNSGDNTVRDTTPDDIVIAPLTDVSTEDFLPFEPVTLSGFDGELTLAVEEGGAFAFVGSFIEVPGKDDLHRTASVSAGDEIIFLHNTSEQYETSVTTAATLSDGDTVVYSFSFTSTTEADPQAQWSTPVALEDGSAATWPVLIDGAGNKPMLTYVKNTWIYTREFDGTDWSTAFKLWALRPDQELAWDVNSNGKAILGVSRVKYNSARGFNECELKFLRYDGNNWVRYSWTARTLIHPTANYDCSSVDDLDIALAGDDSMLMTWWRNDISSSRYQSCDSANQCNTPPLDSASSFSTARRVSDIALGNDGEGKVLMHSTSGSKGVFISEFDTEAGLGSANNIASSQGTNHIMSMALNDAKHSLVVFNETDALKARFHNGSSWSAATTLDADVSMQPRPLLQTYLSDGANYGLTLWLEIGADNRRQLYSNISDAGLFEDSSTQHQNTGQVTGELAANKFAGAINDSSKAVIAWLGYTYDQATNSAGLGTLYSRFYDGNNWQDTQIVDSGIDVDHFFTDQGNIGIYLDNSDEATLVYTAKNNQYNAKLFYSRLTSGSNTTAKLLSNNKNGNSKNKGSKEEAEQIKAELEGAGAEVEVK